MNKQTSIKVNKSMSDLQSPAKLINSSSKVSLCDSDSQSLSMNTSGDDDNEALMFRKAIFTREESREALKISLKPSNQEKLGEATLKMHLTNNKVKKKKPTNQDENEMFKISSMAIASDQNVTKIKSNGEMASKITRKNKIMNKSIETGNNCKFMNGKLIFFFLHIVNYFLPIYFVLKQNEKKLFSLYVHIIHLDNLYIK
jgi:hypothetical protein